MEALTRDQMIALAVLAVVIVSLVSEKLRADVAAMAGAAALALTGVVGPQELQRGLASPALIALASLFVIAHALERTGVIGVLIAQAARLGQWIGALAGPLVIAVSAVISAFLNNTPVVLLAAPLLRDLALGLGRSPREWLIPLSYAAVLAGCCTLIGTSTNLLVAGMAETAELEPFGLFEITPVGLTIAAAGGVYLVLAAPWLLRRKPRSSILDEVEPVPPEPLRPRRAFIGLAVFSGVITAAAFGMPLAAAAFGGAVLLLLMRVMSPEEAYGGLRPNILLMIAGMIVVGIAVEKTGLAREATEALSDWAVPHGPLVALAVLYGLTLFLTEVLSNAAVAVLITPLAIGLAENLGVDPRPMVVGVMMAASAAFATPFGYQTNAIVYGVGGYRYMDFVRVGLPLNLITWVAGVWAIQRFFPF